MIYRYNAEPVRVQTASSTSDGTRCQPALLYGLLEPLSKHLQVCIPHQEGERWEPLL